MYFDYILVIESLRKGEKKTGEELFDSIISRKAEQLNVGCVYVYIKSFQELKELFLKIESNFTLYNKIPLIHMEVHGAEDYMQLESGDKVHWSILAALLGGINNLAKNNLMVVLASCYAINLTRALNVTMVPPYYLLIAPSEKVSPHDIEEGFVQFYEILLEGLRKNDRGESFRKAMQALNDGEKPIFHTTLAEEAFDVIWKEFTERYDTVDKMNKLVDDMLPVSRKGPLSDKQIREIMVTSLDHPEEAKKYFRKSFLMIP